LNKLGKIGALQKLDRRPVAEASTEEIALIPSPMTGRIGKPAVPRAFNLMFQTHIGEVSDEASIAYLRRGTAQGKFANFSNVIATMRIKIPFGMSQIAKSFRNEITPRNFIFRFREFEHIELDFFIEDSEEAWQNWHIYWVDEHLK
jgi:glycyl-tRNA synthetase